jgi:hypothetical protein
MNTSKSSKDFKTIKAVVPNNFHTKFKNKCKKKDVQMNIVLIRLVSKFCNED